MVRKDCSASPTFFIQLFLKFGHASLKRSFIDRYLLQVQLCETRQPSELVDRPGSEACEMIVEKDEALFEEAGLFLKRRVPFPHNFSLVPLLLSKISDGTVSHHPKVGRISGGLWRRGRVLVLRPGQ